MIRHIVFFTARDPADIDRIEAGLHMLAEIPEHRHFEVRRALHTDRLTDREIDIVVYVEFADAEALARYKAHPTYAACIAKVRPLREMRYAADIES